MELSPGCSMRIVASFEVLKCFLHVEEFTVAVVMLSLQSVNSIVQPLNLAQIIDLLLTLIEIFAFEIV